MAKRLDLMTETWKSSSGEKYGWFFFDVNLAWGISLLFMLVVIAVGVGLYVLYNYFSDDPTPDSFIGYILAIVGTLFMFLAMLGYSRARRSSKRKVGRLNASLHWHVSFGVIAVVFLVLHSFGNFNPRTGTFALCSLMALVISGIVGRFLDRIVPWLMAHEVKHMLTVRSGELFGMQGALQREEYYRAIIRYWRIGHVALVFITLGLILWHLEYVATLLLPSYLQ